MPSCLTLIVSPEIGGRERESEREKERGNLELEQCNQPHLRDQPTAAVQYNSWKGGGLIAVSYEARKYGVKRSMRGDEAKQVCPQIQLVQVPVAHGKADLSIYRNAGSELVSILARNGRCECASIDEVYLDLTDAAEAMLAETPPESLEKIDEKALKSHTLSLNEDGSDHKDNVREWLHRSDADQLDKLLACGALIVVELRMQVLKETEFTCSAGIAHNKGNYLHLLMLAKLVSGMNKPAQQTVVPFTSVKGLLERLPIKKITWLWNIARGISEEEVEGRLLPKSHGSRKTFPGPRALKKIASVEHWLNELCEELSERLHSDLEQNKRIAHTLTLHARAFKSSDSESQKNFPSKSCPLRYGSAKIKEDALNLFQAGLREYLGSHRIKAQGSHYNGWGITSLSVTASKIVAIPSGTCSIMKYFHGQDQSNCSSRQVNDRFVAEAAPLSPSGTERYPKLHTTELPIEFREEETRIRHMMLLSKKLQHCHPQSCNNSSCSPKQEHVRTIDETKASSSSSFQSVIGSSELIEAELRKENLLTQMGTHSGMSILDRDDMRRDAWDYKIDEIDPTMVNELPPEIQEELQVWLRPQKRMSRRYDSRTTIFSPEGRLYQVEYAMEAIGNAGTAIGILSKDGVVLVGEKKVTSKLLQTSTSTEKMYKIDDHVACAVAGIMSDANILINTARVQAQRYTYAYQEPMPVEQLVQSLCDTKQGYTQFGGLRPFGVSFLFAGWDKNYGFQLYMSDPSGNYGGWKAAAIGANSQAAQSMLKQDYKDDITREEAVQLVLKVLSKTMDSTSLTSDKLELAEVFLSSGKVKYQGEREREREREKMPVARPESSGVRVIAHLDMDCFYVQVEQRKQPHLRGQPTAVVQYNSWKGGGLIAVSYEAYKYGVVSILARKGRCERASIDELYLDLTDAAEAMLAETPPESLEGSTYTHFACQSFQGSYFFF
ncbi:hypothetical protein HYC85_005013 [Camellia sinensis]|uniref:DNA polymerase eta n=2 Tax=Pentapetalae TaxID=1437201 RepID=A0A7J7I110_CAMSI|nr:hypothetical protein HYC85_005013 [Camellia sinensis]